MSTSLGTLPRIQTRVVVCMSEPVYDPSILNNKLLLGHNNHRDAMAMIMDVSGTNVTLMIINNNLYL